MPSLSAPSVRALSRAAIALPLSLIVATIGVLSTGAAFVHRASAETLPAHQIISDELHDKRRAISVRIQQRLDELDAIRLAKAINTRPRDTATRSFVNFFLPGVAIDQGAWASVVFSPEPKFVAHGLKREDEQVLLAEHRADSRQLLGSWLTPPPAALGRLTIYSNGGRIYAEWRLKNGQKTVDELNDTSTAAGRRFGIADGGHGSSQYVLVRSGDLEIWAGSTRVAVAQRIRLDTVPVSTRLSLGSPSSAAATPISRTSAEAGAKATPASVDKDPSPPLAISNLRVAPAGGSLQTGVSSQPAPARAKARTRTAEAPAATPERARRPQTLTTGDQITAKFAGSL